MSWKKVKLGDLCKMNSGGTPSRSKLEYYTGAIPWVKISDIEDAVGGVILDTEEHISEAGLASINNRIFQKGTLLLAMYGSVGKVAFTGKEMSTNQAILGIRILDENILDYSYLKYWFNTIKEALLDRAVGGTLQNISLGIVKELEIPLPPLETQQHIADILDKADALRRKDQQLLARYDELAQAIFIDMFGDPVKNEKGWEVKKLGNYTKVLTDYHANGSYEKLRDIVTLKKSPDYALMVRTTDLEKNDFSSEVMYISEDAYNFLDKSKVFGREIIINKIGSAGKVYLMPELNRPVSLGMNAFLLRFNDNLDVTFAYYYLELPFGKREINKRVFGAVTKTITKDAVRDIPIFSIPIDQQIKFVQQINIIISMKNKLKANHHNSLFQSLLQKAFKGELDVVEEKIK